jgi:hypothetical protein
MGTRIYDAAISQPCVLQIFAQPVYLKDVIIDGNKTTKTAFLEKELAPLRGARTVAELTQRAAEVTHSLHDLDIFKSVSLVIDKVPAGSSEDVVVRLTVDEKRRINGSSQLNRDLAGENEVVCLPVSFLRICAHATGDHCKRHQRVW